MHTATREEVYATVYNHLKDLYRNMYFNINHVLTENDKAIISFTSYQELIQMGQSGYLNDYYERIRRNAV